MDYKELVNDFSYEELIEAYAGLCKIENIIPVIPLDEDNSLDLNYFSLDIVEGVFHLYNPFNSTSYTGDTRDMILGKIKPIKAELDKAIKESIKKIEN
ncbi:MAG: hypothetical protein P4L22_06360 [Candidatus Babeliales bacterium]|nr:hypothetical protein [Candidatus Babeliales bacterium]